MISELKKIDWKAIAPYIVIPLIFVLCISIYATMGDTQRDKKQYYEIVDLFEDNEVSEYTLNPVSYTHLQTGKFFGLTTFLKLTL